jgi:hypothetical protein
MTALRAQGQRGFDGVTGSGRRRLEEEDGAAGPGTVRPDDAVGLGTARGA